MAINLTLFVFDGTDCPTLTLLDTTSLVVILDGVETDASNTVVQSVLEDSTIAIEITRDGYDSYAATYDTALLSIPDATLAITLFPSAEINPITITQSCHSYTITNTGTSLDENITYTITDLDGIVITDYLNVAVPFGSSSVFTTTIDGVYLLLVKDTDDIIIRKYVIIDICTILSCYTNRLLNILCSDCDCGCEDCQDYCKKDYDMKRINLLFFDLFNRINREYRLNSYYTVVDDSKITELKTAQEDIDKLLTYCSTCGDTTTPNLTTVLNSSPSNSDCGCS